MALKFGDLELDRARFELRLGGERVHLEPRVLELLLYLAENRERVVTKQELFDAVWKSKFVSESTLSGAIAEARRALGGGAPQKSPIQTVHGRGYRFVAPVATGGSGAPSAPAGTRSPRGRPWRSGSRAVLLGGFLSAVALVLVWRLSGLGPTRTGAPARAVRLVLAPFEAPDSDDELRLVALSIRDLLSRRLDRIEGLELEIPGTGLPWTETPALGALREMAGGAYLVTGALRPSPDSGRARLALQLYDFGSAGDPVPVRLTEHDVPFLRDNQDLRHFLRLRDSIVGQVLERLSPVVAPPPGGDSPPRDPEAYRLYLQTLQPLREAVCVGPSALALLERSLALDPDFAPAWAELGWARYNLVSSCGESGDNYDAALAAADRALALDPEAARALGLRAVVLAETGEAEEAYAGLSSADQGAHRARGDVPFFRSYVLNYAGYLERSQAFCEEALRRDPTFLADGGWTPNAFLYRREWERFLEHLPAGGSPLFRFYRGFAELQLGRRQPAQRVLAPAFETAPNDLFARLSQALLAAVEGRLGEARILLDQVALQRQKTGAGDGEVAYKLGQLYALAGDRAKARAQATLAVEQGFFCAPCFQGDLLLAPILSDPAFAPALAAAHARHLAFGRRFDLVP